MGGQMDFFRIALIELKARKRKKIPEIAKAAGVSTRHIQGVLSNREMKGMGPAAQLSVAEFFKISLEEMISLGMSLSKKASDGGEEIFEPPEKEDHGEYHQKLNRILKNKKYSTAIIHNLDAFDNAAEGDEEMKRMEEKMERMEKMLEVLLERSESKNILEDDKKRDRAANE